MLIRSLWGVFVRQVRTIWDILKFLELGRLVDLCGCALSTLMLGGGHICYDLKGHSKYSIIMTSSVLFISSVTGFNIEADNL